MATEVVKTIRASGGDYTSLSAWVTGEERDLVTADEIAVAEFYDDWPSGLADQADLVSGNWTVDSTHYIKWTVADGHRHNGTPQSGFFIEENSNFDLLFDNDVDHVVIEWLDFTNTASSGNGLQLTGSNNVLVDKCIGDTGGNTFNCAGTCCVRNTLAHGGDGSSNGFTGQNFNPDHYYYNCTATGHSTGFNGESHTVYINCVAFGCTTDYGPDFDTLSSHNASDDATASNIPGSDSVAGVVSGDFVDSANADMHLASGSALEDVGTDLSGDSNWPFSDDVDGDTRSGTWDIGFDEIASSVDRTVSGNVQAQNATAAGSLAVKASLSGGVQAQDATVAGTVDMLLALSGAVAAQNATAAGSISTSDTRTISGGVQAQDASCAGSLSLTAALSGAVQAQNATVSGTLSVVVSITGSVQAQDAFTSGSLLADTANALSGDVQAQNATAAGSISLQLDIQGSVMAGDATVLGSIGLSLNWTGDDWDSHSVAGDGMTEKSLSVSGMTLKSLSGSSWTKH